MIAADDPIVASPKFFIFPLHCTPCLADSLKYLHIGVTKTPCDERRDAFLQRCSSHGVAKLSYGDDGIIIDTTPRSHQGNVWESFI